MVFHFRVSLGEGKMGFLSSSDFIRLGEGMNLLQEDWLFA